MLPGYLIAVITFLISFANTYAISDLPRSFPRCSRDDPDLNRCMVRAANAAKPFLMAGIPELNLAPISPYKMPDASIEQGTQSLHFQSMMYNTTVYGLESYEVKELNFDVANSNMFGRIIIPELTLKGHYRIDTNILSIPLVAQGVFAAKAKNVGATLKQDIKQVQRNGITYIKSINLTIDVDIDPKDVAWLGEGDNNGNELVDRITTDIINNNLGLIIEDVKPICLELLQQIVHNMLEKIHARVPYDRLYPTSG